MRLVLQLFRRQFVGAAGFLRVSALTARSLFARTGHGVLVRFRRVLLLQPWPFPGRQLAQLAASVDVKLDGIFVEFAGHYLHGSAHNPGITDEVKD